MSEVTRHQLLITLVHGTWPRGFFPTLRRQNRRPLWFEEGSPFLARLSTELGDIPHQIKPLIWSGANSIFVRDKTARVLAEYLSAEHIEHPQATQIIIAHSHGGNIALRALHHLQKRDASQFCMADSANPSVVTLATPFIEIHQANFGRRPLFVRVAMTFATTVLLGFSSMFLAILIAESPLLLLVGSPAVVFCTIGMGLWWSFGRAIARQNKLRALEDATRLGAAMSVKRLLVVRAINDEASLVLALGTIVNYLTMTTVTLMVVIYCITNLLLQLHLFAEWGSWLPEASWEPGWAYVVPLGALTAIFIFLGVVLLLSRSVHGRELPTAPMECQINTQSAPDAVDLSQVVTLVSYNYVKSLRHGIYEHDNCAKAISDWVRSQLGGLR
jgi:hypothetical protein